MKKPKVIEIDISKIEPVFHSPIRIAILSILISAIEADFNYLKKATKTTDGNLSSHLSKLEKEGFIEIKKSFSEKKPLTTCRITKKGKKAFLKYINIIDDVINIARSAKTENNDKN